MSFPQVRLLFCEQREPYSVRSVYFASGCIHSQLEVYHGVYAEDAFVRCKRRVNEHEGVSLAR